MSSLLLCICNVELGSEEEGAVVEAAHIISICCMLLPCVGKPGWTQLKVVPSVPVFVVELLTCIAASGSEFVLGCLLPDAVRCVVTSWSPEAPEAHMTTMLLPAICLPVPTPSHPSADPWASVVRVKLVLDVDAS
jgi:hypothetical protein